MAFEGVGGAATADFAAGGFGGAFGGGLTEALLSGMSSAVLSGGAGGAGSVLYNPGDSFAGAFSWTTSGVGSGTPDTLPTTFTCMPPEPPVVDPQFVPKEGNNFGERTMNASSAPCKNIDATTKRSNLSRSNVISYPVP